MYLGFASLFRWVREEHVPIYWFLHCNPFLVPSKMTVDSASYGGKHIISCQIYLKYLEHFE